MTRPDFDFDTPVNRHRSGSYKWDSNGSDEVLPMFVADMDFRTAPVILDALQQRLDHGVFGYTWIRDEYYEALAGWFQRRYQYAIRREEVIPTIGIVPAISAILRALTNPGDGVIVQTPVYHCFFSSIRRLGCDVVENPLQLDEDGVYQINFDELEQLAARPENRLMLLCHPHNPSGRVWSTAELQRIGEICLRHGVVVVSDEIHCDLLFPGVQHRPFASIAAEFREHCITLHSPGKTFNLAGLQIANLLITNRELRNHVLRALQQHEITGVNPFGVEALIAACNLGEPWLDALQTYLYDNYRLIAEFLQQRLPSLRLYPQQSTYLAWIDCSATGLNGDQLAKRLLDEGRLRISSGMGFESGRQHPNSYIRLNFACSRSTLNNGLERLEAAIRSIITGSI